MVVVAWSSEFPWSNKKVAIQDVVEWPAPQRLKDVRAFVVLCSYYRRFIRDSSMIATLLFALTKKGEAFVWDLAC